MPSTTGSELHVITRIFPMIDAADVVLVDFAETIYVAKGDANVEHLGRGWFNGSYFGHQQTGRKPLGETR